MGKGLICWHVGLPLRLLLHFAHSSMPFFTSDYPMNHKVLLLQTSKWIVENTLVGILWFTKEQWAIGKYWCMKGQLSLDSVFSYTGLHQRQNSGNWVLVVYYMLPVFPKSKQRKHFHFFVPLNMHKDVSYFWCINCNKWGRTPWTKDAANATANTPQSSIILRLDWNNV